MADDEAGSGGAFDDGEFTRTFNRVLRGLLSDPKAVERLGASLDPKGFVYFLQVQRVDRDGLIADPVAACLLMRDGNWALRDVIDECGLLIHPVPQFMLDLLHGPGRQDAREVAARYEAGRQAGQGGCGHQSDNEKTRERKDDHD